MKILSLFDGVSCARLALEKNKIEIEKYYACEIDKYASKVTQANRPDTIPLGDVRNVTTEIVGDIDLLIGGSPCQDLSIAKANRKGLDGERSGLFYEYVRILRELKPKYFILENVASMPKEARDTITKEMGVEPTMINASLVSAQNRKRLFWTNIPNVIQPEDKGIILKDILESGDTDRLKSYCIDASYYKGANWKQYIEKGRRQLIKIGHMNSGGQGDRIYSQEGKSVALSANGGGRGAKTGLYVVALTETRTEEAKAIRRENMKNGKDFSPRRAKELVPRKDEKSNTITTGQTKESLILQDTVVRKLTPIECERLQCMPDNWTNPTGDISNTQRYKMCGNAFNVDVVAHILSFINN